MIKSIIFDIGQVLVSFDWRAYLSGFGFAPDKEELIANAVFLNPNWSEGDRGVWTEEQLLDAFYAKAPQYREDIKRVYLDAWKAVGHLDYTIPWLIRLKEQGFQLYYLSNYPKRMRELDKGALDFIPYMDGGIFSYQVHLIKPDRAIFQALVNKYPEIIPSEAVFFDDNAENVAAASAFGIHGIVFQHQMQAVEELSKLL